MLAEKRGVIKPIVGNRIVVKSPKLYFQFFAVKHNFEKSCAIFLTENAGGGSMVIKLTFGKGIISRIPKINFNFSTPKLKSQKFCANPSHPSIIAYPLRK